MPDRTPLVPASSLAVYGTLAPGESNHREVEGIDGRWVEGSVRGHRFQAVWRDTPGYPGYRHDPAGPLVPVLVLVSVELSVHWERLDAFEGPGYRRREVEVFDRPGDRAIGVSWIYETLVDTLDSLGQPLSAGPGDRPPPGPG